MKLGMVLEGGASRTFFSVGAMDALLELEIYTDYLIGVSAGVAYGTSYVSRQKGRCLTLGEKFLADKRYMGMKYFWKNGYITSSGRLDTTIVEYFSNSASFDISALL